MENYQVRLLTENDRSQVLEVANSHTKIMKQEKDQEYQEWFESFLTKVLLKTERTVRSSPHRLVGSFVDGKLVAFIGQIYWATMPYWTIKNMTVRVGANNALRVYRNGLGACIDYAATLAEEDQIFTFYWLTEATHWNVREKLFSAGTETFRRYIILTEEVIPPGVYPKFPHQQSLMGGKKWSRKVAIKAAHLKKGYRHDYFLKKKLLDEPFVDLQGNGY